MKQFDIDASNYKNKEEVKTFIQSFNELVDKFVKAYDGKDADLNKINAGISKKEDSISKLDVTLADLANKTDELKSLKELSNNEISELNLKKSEISYTDSEVQKMELDDINSQIAQRKNKISKIDVKMDATKAKIKTSNEEKKACEKELKELEKNRKVEEEALYRTEGLLRLVDEVKTVVNDKIEEILSKPYQASTSEFVHEEPTVVLEEVVSDETVVSMEENNELDNITQVEESIQEESTLAPEEPEVVMEEPASEDEGDTQELVNSVLVDRFRKEGIDFDKFSDETKNAMNEKQEEVCKNLDILKKHSVPLDYTLDQPEIYYNISSQDLDDLLSIITTDEDGNGMGFTIDFTYNILNELSKINVDKLIDVYNSEFMNVNAKSGIIHLLKLTNPDLDDFAKNRSANVSLLESLGTTKVDEIVENYKDFINMDNPLFQNVLNMFDREDLLEKLEGDLEVIPKIVEYWKNN